MTTSSACWRGTTTTVLPPPARWRRQGKTVIYKMGHRGAITLTREDEFRTGIYTVER